MVLVEMVAEEVDNLAKKIKNNYLINKTEALELVKIPAYYNFSLFSSANLIRHHFKGRKIELCAIVNAKSGYCSEDCTFCAQSSISKADIIKYQLIDEKQIIDLARNMKSYGVKRFSIVTSGRKVSKKEILKIADIITEIKKIDLLPCASLGLLKKEELKTLKSAGLERYHHNLETSERYFPMICTSHSYKDKLITIESALSVGLSMCSGGVFGLGESWIDRIDMAFKLRELGIDSVPINFLIPIKGTKLGMRKPLKPLEALKIVSIYRFILPKHEVRICGGRLQILKEFHPFVIFSGADSIMTGNYLTTMGRKPEDDINMIKLAGYEI